MRLRLVVTALTCCVAFTPLTVAAQTDVAQALRQQYADKLLVLRHSLQGKSQRYDSDGKILSSASEGPWTLYGRIKVEQIEVSTSALEIKGYRVDYKYDAQLRQLAPFPNKVRAQITISLAHPLANLAEANAVLGSVFALTKKDVLASVPEFWRSYLENNIAPIPAKTTSVTNAVLSEELPELGAQATKPAPTQRHVIGPGVSPPQAVFTPEPAFPDRANKESYQGVLVLNVTIDETGKPRDIHVVRPLGMGMEEAAFTAVSSWRFKPSKHDGKPVAVEMNIEVAFNKF